MLEESASVVSVEGNLARVSLTRSEACGSCSAKNMCHPTGEKSMEMEVLNSAGAQPGDRVIISLPPGDLLKASATAYMLPAIAAVAGGAIGWKKTGTDIGAIIGCLAGLILATIWLFIQSRRKAGPVPFISRILKDGRTTG
jgi:sigma-E factor negative regulatory protein RseC